MTTPGTNFIGVNISGPHARAALVDSEGRILERRDADITPENFVPQLAELAAQLRKSQNVAAFGLPSRDSSIDKLIASSQRAIFRRNLVEDLHGSTNARHRFASGDENDANAELTANSKSAPAGSRNLFYMMIGKASAARSFSTANFGPVLRVLREKLVTSRSTQKGSNVFAATQVVWKQLHPHRASCAARENV